MSEGSEETGDSSQPSASTSDQFSTGVVLPNVGSGRRRERRLQDSRRRRNRIVGVLAAAVLIVSVVGVAAVLLDRRDGVDALDESVDESDEPVAVAAPKALLLQLDEQADLVGVSALFLRDERPGGSVLLMPVSTYVDIPGFGFEPLTQAHSAGGEELVRLTIENLLGVTFDQVRVLDPRSWRTLLADDSPLSVENPTEVLVDDGEGAARLRYPEGEVELAAGDTADYLNLTGFGEAELERLGRRHNAFWRAWLDALAERPVGPGLVERDLPQFLSRLASGEVAVRLMPVEEIFQQESETAYRVLGDELDEVMPELAPETAGGAAQRIRVQLLNGVGTPGLAPRVTELLVPAGIRVDLRGNARTFDYDTTLVVYYRDEDQPLAERVRDALGVGEIARDTNVIDIVEVTVIMGRDLATRVAG